MKVTAKPAPDAGIGVIGVTGHLSDLRRLTGASRCLGLHSHAILKRRSPAFGLNAFAKCQSPR